MPYRNNATFIFLSWVVGFWVSIKKVAFLYKKSNLFFYLYIYIKESRKKVREKKRNKIKYIEKRRRKIKVSEELEAGVYL